MKCFQRFFEAVGNDQSVGMVEDLDLYVRFLLYGHLDVYRRNEKYLQILEIFLRLENL